MGGGPQECCRDRPQHTDEALTAHTPLPYIHTTFPSYHHNVIVATEILSSFGHEDYAAAAWTLHLPESAIKHQRIDRSGCFSQPL